jgi:hypothetical protein
MPPNVLNLTEVQLTNDEKAALSHNLKFVPIPTLDPLVVGADLRRLTRNMRNMEFFADRDRNDPDSEREEPAPTPSVRPQTLALKSRAPPPFCAFAGRDPALDLYLSVINRVGRDPETFNRKWSSNLSASAKRGIRSLKQKTDKILCRPTDKTNGIAILDRNTYIAAVKKEILSDTDAFRQLDLTKNAPAGDRGILNKRFDELRKMVHEEFVKRNLKHEDAISLIPYDYKFGNVHANVKSHKMVNLVAPLTEEIPFRLIFSSKGTIIEAVDKYIERIITPLIKEDATFLLDTTQFIESISEVNHLHAPMDAGQTTIFVRDVKALYPNTPLEEGLAAVGHLLQRRQFSPPASTIMRFLKFIMNSNLFAFDNLHMIQKDGVAIGFASSPPVAVAWRAEKEKLFIYSQPSRNLVENLVYFKVYIDDSFGVWIGDQPSFANFTEMMNQVHRKLQYTGEEGHSVNMLDTCVTLKDSCLTISMYRKPTANPQALSFNSCHPLSCLRSIPMAAFKRICRINSDKKDALEWILDAERNFKKAGYPEDLIAKSKETAVNTPREQLLQRTERNADQVPTAFFVTTFHPGLIKVSSALHERFHILQESDNCRQVFARPPVKAWKRGTNMKEILCPSTLPPLLIEPKRKGFSKCNQPGCSLCPFTSNIISFCINGYQRPITQSLNCKSRSGIYTVLCQKCDKFYIGRTADTLEMRFKQHKRDVDNSKSLKPLPRHFSEPGHIVSQHLRMFMFHQCRDWRRLADLESECIALFKTQRAGLNGKE